MELLPSNTDWTMATGRTGGSEEHTSQVDEADVSATESPLPTPAAPFPAPLTPGLTGSSLMSIMHFSLVSKVTFVSAAFEWVPVSSVLSICSDCLVNEAVCEGN